MSYAASVDSAIVQEWVKGKIETSAVKRPLVEKGWNGETIAARLAEFKRLMNRKR